MFAFIVPSLSLKYNRDRRLADNSERWMVRSLQSFILYIQSVRSPVLSGLRFAKISCEMGERWNATCSEQLKLRSVKMVSPNGIRRICF